MALDLGVVSKIGISAGSSPVDSFSLHFEAAVIHVFAVPPPINNSTSLYFLLKSQ